MSLTRGAKRKQALLCIMARIVESMKEPRVSMLDLVELKGARITDLLEQFFRKEFWVESSLYGYQSR